MFQQTQNTVNSYYSKTTYSLYPENGNLSQLSQYYSPAVSSYGSNGRDVEPFYTLNTLSDPYSLQSQKRKYIFDVYKQIHNGKIPNVAVLKQKGMDPAGEKYYNTLAQMPTERWTPQDAKWLGEFLWKGFSGQTDMSRFFSRNLVNERDIGNLASRGTRFDVPQSSLEPLAIENGGDMRTAVDRPFQDDYGRMGLRRQNSA